MKKIKSEYVCSDIAFYNHIKFIQNITKTGGGKILCFKNFDIFINTKTSIATYIFLKNTNISESDISDMIGTAKEIDVQFALPLERNHLFFHIIKTVQNSNKFFLGSVAKDSYMNIKHLSIYDKNRLDERFDKNPDLIFLDILTSQDLFDEYNKLSSHIFHHSITEIPFMLKGIRDGEDKNTRMFIVKKDDHTVGMCGYFFNEEKKIGSLYADGIKEEFRRCGLGTSMVLKRMEMLIDKNCDIITVNNMPDSVLLYRRLGFKSIGDLIFFISK